MSFRGVLGHEFVGEVVAGGALPIGSRVVGEINCPCRSCDLCSRGLAKHCRRRTVLGIQGRDGAFAEQLVLPSANLHLLPDAVGDEDAVFVEPLAAAIQVLKQVPVESRMRVAVLGAGKLGLLVAQVLARAGCHLEVVGRNPLGLQFCDRRGIQSVQLQDVVPRKSHDLVVDCTGDPGGLNLAMEMVRPRGTIVLKSTCAGAAQTNLAPLVIDEVCLLGSRCGPFPDAIAALAQRQVDVATLVSRVLPLDRGMEALQAARDRQNIKVLLKVKQ